MPTLLLVSLYEFKQFLQIVLWIAVPGTIIAIAITTVLHYRRKKALLNEPELEPVDSRLYMAGDMGQIPDWLASTNPDNTSLLKKYEREVRRYKENYAALEQDFRSLEDKYADLLNKAYHNDQSGNEAIDKLHQEIKGYKLKIAQLQQAIDFRDESKPAENGKGSDPMELHDLRIRFAQLEEENTSLKGKLEESQYMRDLLDEKKAQTEFLQQQLELRIKNYHLLEKQTSGASTELAQLRAAAEEFNSKEQALLVDLEQKHEAIRSQAEHIKKLESGLDELHQQQSALQTFIDDKQSIINKLENAFNEEHEKTKQLEQKLELSNQLFARIYAELGKSLDPGLVNGHNGSAASTFLEPATTAN
jgi:chromosome segregation ATPase